MFQIVSIFALMASACAGGYHHLLPHTQSIATLGGPAVLSGVVGPSVWGVPTLSRYAQAVEAPIVSSQVYAPSVLAHQHLTVARPASVAVERVSYGSVPSVSVVNEPTTIVSPGKPIRGHSYTSEVRHDSVARIAAPLVATYAAPAFESAHVLEAPLVSSVSAYPSTYVSAPQILATGPASVVAAPASVKGYTLETGRTHLVNEVRLRSASIPTTVLHDTVVESVPAVAPVARVLSSPLLSTYWKK